MKRCKEIVFVRHALALDKEIAKRENIPDPSRELTKAGRKEFKKFILKQKKYFRHSTLLLSSPFKRAIQTAELIQHHISPLDIHLERRLEPEASVEDLIDFMKSLPEQKTVFVSHDPLMSLVLQKLLHAETKNFKLKKGALVIFRLNADQTFELRQWINP